MKLLSNSNKYLNLFYLLFFFIFSNFLFANERSEIETKNKVFPEVNKDYEKNIIYNFICYL